MDDTGRHSTPALERLHALLQHVTPQHLLTALMYRATRVRWRPWKSWQIRWFTRRYGVDLREALNPEERDYEHFNAFFTRALREDARPLCGEDDALMCPADGRVSAVGEIRAGKLLQAKGRWYTLDALLGGDDRKAAAFENGCFATVYLAPRDYHRVHMPLAGHLREMTYIPGRMFSVDFTTARTVDNIFARNERLVCHFETVAGPMAVILVGAMIVAGLETVWSGAVTPPHGDAARTWRYAGEDAPRIDGGAELGRFNIGSTVIVLLPAGCVRWRKDLQTGSRVRMGEALGRLVGAGSSPPEGGSTAES